MAYKVANKRNDDGTYTMSFGRGSKKLQALVVSHETCRGGKRGWMIADGHGADEVQPQATQKELKEAWGLWCEAAYSDGEDDTIPAPDGSDGSAPVEPAIEASPDAPDSDLVYYVGQEFVDGVDLLASFADEFAPQFLAEHPDMLAVMNETVAMIRRTLA